MPPSHFADRLSQAILNRGTPLIVGIDPRWEHLPTLLRKSIDPKQPASVADAFARFGTEVIDAVAAYVAAIKPQAAFFEALGPAGMEALARVIRHARDRGILVILDGKRNDIGSTATAYAQAYLGPAPESAWSCDALTVNPYLGDDSLTPFIEQARETASGLFVLVKTSNPGSQTFQELTCGDRKLYQHVAAWVQQAAAQTTGECGYGIPGAVVGATHPDHLAELRVSMPNTFFLIPGFGAQGGKAADIAQAFDDRGGGAVVNSSRAIIFAYERPEFASTRSWQQAVEQATRQSIEVLKKALNEAGKTKAD